MRRPALAFAIVLSAAALGATVAAPAVAAPAARAHKARRGGSDADRLVRTGKLVEAAAVLRAEANDASRSASARKKAQAALDALEPRLAHLVLQVPAAFTGSISVDGEPIEVAKWSAPVAVDPGEHEVKARSSNGVAVHRITIRERERQVLAIASDVAPSPTTSPSTSPTTSPSTSPSTSTSTSTSAPATAGAGSGAAAPSVVTSTSPWRTVGFVGLGTGALSLAAGGVFAILASNERSTLAARCPNDVCSEADRAAYDRGRTDANVATILLAAGAVVTVASVGLVIFGGPKKEDASMQLRASASGVRLEGRFQ